MSAEIKIAFPSGSNLYAVVRNEAALVYYIVGTVFEAWATGGRDADDYDYPMTGDAGDMYVANFPTIAAGRYSVTIFKRLGASAADSDTPVGAEEIWWNGTSEETQAEYELNAYDPPTNTEMEARTLVSADYTIVSDLGTVQTADHTVAIADIPTVAEFEARTLVSADYVVVGDTLARVTLVDTTTTNTDMVTDNAAAIAALNDFDPATDTVARVTLVDTTTANTDMRGTDSAAVAGDEMALIDDAITSAKYDESTAFPLATEDSSGLVSTALSGVSDSVDMFNIALGLIGEYEVEDDDTTSKQYKLCNRFYTQALKKALSMHPWNEAIETDIIMQSTTAPLTEFSYQYAKPSDCLQIRSIGSDEYHWEVQGQNIVTDYARIPDSWFSEVDYVAGQYVSISAVTYLCDTSHTSTTWAADTAYWTSQVGDYKVIDVTYIKLLTDVTLMSTNLIDTITHELAIMVVVGITGDTKAKEDLLEQFNKDIVPQARSIDAVEGRLKRPYQSAWVKARS